MTEKQTLTPDAVLSASTKQAARIAGAMTKTPSDRNKRFDRSKPGIFDPNTVVMYQNQEKKDDINACWVGVDGKTPDPKSQAEIELPPFLIARGSKIFGEGDAFKEVVGKKGVKVSRGSAHFRLILVEEVSDEMAAIYPEWRAMQRKAVDAVRAATIKLITNVFQMKTPPNNWVPFINAALKAARNSITIPDRKKLTDTEIDERIDASAELRKELGELALEYFIKEARYPFKPSIDPLTKQPRQIIASIEAKVYAVTDFKEDVYNNKNDGPDEIAFPSKKEHIHHVIEIMKTLRGKGEKGTDKRLYTPIVFVNKMAKRQLTDREIKAKAKAERKHAKAVAEAKAKDEPLPPPLPKPLDPIADRPNIQLDDGTIVPDYWWNPTTMQNGVPVQSYGVAVGGFEPTASELGGYGIKFIMRNGRKVHVVDYEDVPEREIEEYGKRIHQSDQAQKEPGDDDDDDSDDDADEPPTKRQKADEEKQQEQHSWTEPPPTNAGAEDGGTGEFEF